MKHYKAEFLKEIVLTLSTVSRIQALQFLLAGFCKPACKDKGICTFNAAFNLENSSKMTTFSACFSSEYPKGYSRNPPFEWSEFLPQCQLQRAWKSHGTRSSNKSSMPWTWRHTWRWSRLRPSKLSVISITCLEGRLQRSVRGPKCGLSTGKRCSHMWFLRE